MWLLLLFVVSLSLGWSEAQQCAHGLQRCQWEAWSAWSSCSKTCGEGTRTRNRGLCCKVDETFDDCISDCGIPYESFESESCLFVCPTETCSYTKLNDTGIEATDYKPEIDFSQQKIELSSVTHDTCEKYCTEANIQNGNHCWGIVFDGASSKCTIYFFNKPFSLNPEKAGTNPGSSLMLRRCTGENKCDSTAADVVFIIDSSGSIGSTNFRLVKGFLQSVVRGLDIDPNYTRVGVIRFSDDASWQFRLDDHTGISDVLQAIEKIPYQEGGTQTSAALDLLRKYDYPGNRTVPQIAVVVTDGLSRYPSLTRVLANILRQQGVFIYAIGVGNKTDHDELFDLASMPEKNFMYEFSSFQELARSNISLQVDYLPCKVTTPTTGNVNGTDGGNGTVIITSNCKDTIDNCEMYGRDSCTDFGPWAHEHCPLFCGFCEGPKTSPAPCTDAIDNCASFGKYVCEEKSYISWVNTNCRKFCGVCKSDETTTKATTTPTTPVPICMDHIDNCDGYKPSCNDPQYRGYLEARCPATCGFCKSFEIHTGQLINGNQCPDWKLPTECTLEKPTPDCCPLPKCPDGYIVTAERIIE